MHRLCIVVNIMSEKKSITFFTHICSSGYEKLKHGTYERLIIIIPRELRPLIKRGRLYKVILEEA